VRLAGPHAEKLFTGRWNERAAGFDRLQLLDLGRQLATEVSTTTDCIITHEAIRASRLLAENWPCVEAVAAALLEYDRLTGREVRAIVKGAKLS
jgi:ATP-dependent Zn protease